MTFPFILLGLLLGGILTVVSLIFTIIYLANWDQRKFAISVSCFVASLVVVILSIVYAVQTAKEKVKDAGENFMDWAEKMDKKSKHHKDYYHNEKMDSLRAWEPEQYKDSVREDFYEMYSNGTYRIPLVYPYSISSYEYDLSNSFLESDLKSNQADSLSMLKNITDITYDRNYLIARIDNREGASENETEVFYVVFNFPTGKLKIFPNQSKALAEAEKLGYTGRQYLQEISTVYNQLADY